MALATLTVQVLCALALGLVTLGLASTPAVRRVAMALRRTPLPRALLLFSVVLTVGLLAVGAGGLPAPVTVESLGIPTVVFLVAGVPMLSLLLSGHLELFAAATVLADLWRERDPGDLTERLAVGRYLVRTYHDWAATASFVAGLLGLTVGVSLSLATAPSLRLSGLVYSTVGLYALGLTTLTADHPYYRADEGPTVRAVDRLVAARDRTTSRG